MYKDMDNSSRVAEIMNIDSELQDDTKKEKLEEETSSLLSKNKIEENGRNSENSKNTSSFLNDLPNVNENLANSSVPENLLVYSINQKTKRKKNQKEEQIC